jgi:hypothetical protein
VVSLHAPGISRRQTSPSPRGNISAADPYLFSVAGSVAEEIDVTTDGLGEVDPWIGDLDGACARRYGRSLVPDESGVEANLEVVRQDVTRMIGDRRGAVDGLATALFDRLRLNAEETAAMRAPGTAIG